MADGEALRVLAGAVSELAEDGRQGEVEPGATRQEPGGAGAAFGGVEPGAEPELPRRLLAAAALPAGRPQGDHGDGAQAGADRVQHHALRRGLHEADRGGLRRAGAGTVREAVAAPGPGVGLHADED